MKKVGIQTPHYANNYGAQLQAYALGEAIKKTGFNIEYIDRRPCLLEHRNLLKRIIKKLELNTSKRGFKDFETKYINPKSIKITDNKDYKLLDCKKYYAIVVGSDQIWRDDYFLSSFEYSPYLYYVKDKNIRKISYAASFGKNNCKQPEERRKNIAYLLKDFWAISVREKSGVNILNEEFGVKGVWVLDPTLLHKSSFYIESLHLVKLNKERDEIVTYILGGDKVKYEKMSAVAQSMGLSIRHIYNRKHYSQTSLGRLLAKFVKIPSVVDWLDLILNAKYVITDSFHGMVFSIIFNKQFVVLNNIGGGTERYLSLLKEIGLEDRLLEWNVDENVIMQKLEDVIDYNQCYKLLDEAVSSSLEYLKISLS